MSLTIVQSSMGKSGNPSLSFPSGTGTVAVQGLSTNVVSGTAQASTSGTSITFTGIPSYAKRITVMFAGVTTNSTSNPLIQVGTGSLVTTGYKGAAGVITSAGASGANFTTGFGLTIATATYDMNGSIVLTLQNSATNTWTAQGSVLSSTVVANWFTGGSISLSGALQQIVITTVGGTATFNAGSINILYE